VLFGELPICPRNLRLEDPKENRKVERTAGIRSDFPGLVFRSGVEARHSVPDPIGSNADQGGSADPIEAKDRSAAPQPGDRLASHESARPTCDASLARARTARLCRSGIAGSQRAGQRLAKVGRPNCNHALAPHVWECLLRLLDPRRTPWSGARSFRSRS
jgi:hypothetical protein